MTASTIALAELAEKGADIDVLRQMVQLVGPAKFTPPLRVAAP